jgi:Methionyl-tRNA formyltransferase
MFKKIVFMGTSYFAVPILKSLYQNGYPISVVYTQPPKKSNRGQKLNKSQINLFSENISLKIRTPQFLKNNKEEELYLSNLKQDLIIVVAYGQIIPKEFVKNSKIWDF